MPILEAKNLTYIYSKGTPSEKTAVDDISIEIKIGETLAVIGHTGSGKSTLIQHLNGLYKADSGAVYFKGKDIWENKNEIKNIRFKIGLCFQYPEYQLFEETVFRDIAYGPKNMGLDEKEIERRVLKAAEYMNIPRDYLEKSPFDLSGGEKRKVAMAGILAVEPEVLVLDEPTAGLDPRGRENLFSLIENYKKNTGTTVVFVSHSMEDVAKLADRIIVINGGKVAMQGNVKEIFSRAEELEEMGLNVPVITKVFMRLKNDGYDVEPVYTVTAAAEALKKLIGGKYDN